MCNQQGTFVISKALFVLESVIVLLDIGLDIRLTRVARYLGCHLTTANRLGHVSLDFTTKDLQGFSALNESGGGGGGSVAPRSPPGTG